jgi:hypothetical protein
MPPLPMLPARAGEAVVAPQCFAAPSKQCMRPMSRTRDLKGRAQKRVNYYRNEASNFVLLRSLKKACIYV